MRIHLVHIAVLALLATSCGPPATRSIESETQIFALEQVYKSMFGPRDRDRLTLLETDAPEILWVTAIQAKLVGADGESAQSAEFFCHSAFSRLQGQAEERIDLLGHRLGHARKMFTLVQGLTEIRFPDGFGLPVLSNDEFVSSVMVMNPIERSEPVHVGVDSRIEFVREADARGQIQPLFLVPLVTKVPVEGHAYHVASADEHADHSEQASHAAAHPEGDAESCLSHDEDLAGAEVAKPVDRSSTSVGSPVTENPSGFEQTGHWHVPPGHHVYSHRLERIEEKIPFDARAHYISAHLHPFGTSLELVDLTTGETVFKSLAENFPNRVALREITHYSSAEGMLIHSDHDYEIIATYDNTTDGDVDSMAVMYLYLADANPERVAQH